MGLYKGEVHSIARVCALLRESKYRIANESFNKVKRLQSTLDATNNCIKEGKARTRRAGAVGAGKKGGQGGY